MRNLKRALSLTLASVMLLGMMVVGSSAASYPDVEDTHNVEAIEVLQAIKVMVGDDNGNFGPDDQVNRSQMAVVMALLLDLDYDYYKGTNPFWDVPSWAEPYVAACYANGIVSGYNATTYGAGDPVTAVQAASMMMRALGYFQHQTDYRDGFELSTVRQASKISLFKDVNAASNNSALTRNQVAQLALNTLKTPMVEGKDNTLNINTGSNAGNISITGGSMDYVYVTSNDPKFNEAIDDVSAASMGSTNLGTLVELGEKLFNGDLELEKNDTDDFGRPSNTWTYKNTKIGTYGHRGELIATFDGKVSKENIYGLLSGTVRNALEDTDTDSAKLTVTVDGNDTAGMGGKPKGDTGSDKDNWYKKNDSTAIYTYKGRNHNDGDYGSSRKGTLTEVYVDDDKNVDIVIVNTYVYQATSDYSSARDEVRMATVGDTSVQLTANGLTLDGEDFNIENIKEDDYLLVTVAYNGTNYDVKSVDVAEKLQGEVTGYAVGDTVTIDGTKYNYSAICGKSSGTAPEAVRSTTYTVGQPAIVVLDKYGNIIAVDEAMAASNFVFVEKVGKDGNMDVVAKAKMYFTDGSKGTFNVDRMDWSGKTYKSADTIAAQNVTNTWFTYSKNSDGNYVLYNVPSGYTPDNASKHTDNVLLKNGKVDFLAAESDHLANDETILIMVDNDGDLSTYTGTQNIPDVKMKSGDATVYYLYDDDKYVDYAFVNLEDKNVEIIDGGEEDSFLYVLKFANENKGKDNDSVFEYTTIDDETGAEQPSNFDKAIADGDIKDGNGERLNNTAKITRGSKDGIYSLFYKPREKDGEITSVRVVPNDNSKYFNEKVENATVTYAKGSITFSTGDNKYIVNKNSKLTLVALKGTEGVMKDSTKDYQIYASATAADLESILKDKSFKGVLQGCTINETSSVVDTMYVTIDEVNADTFAGVSVSPTSLTIPVGATTNATVTLPSGVTIKAVGTDGTRSENADIATVAVSSPKVAVTGVAVDSTEIIVVLTKGSEEMEQRIPVTVTKAAEAPILPDKPGADDFGNTKVENPGNMPEQKVEKDDQGNLVVKEPIDKDAADASDTTIGGFPMSDWITEANGVILRFDAPKGWASTTGVVFNVKDGSDFGRDWAGTADGTEDGTDFATFILNFADGAARTIQVKVTWTANDSTTYTHTYDVKVPATTAP